MPTPPTDQLTRFQLEDITQGSSPLLVGPFGLLESLHCASYEQAELMLLDRLPTKLSRYYLIFRLDALWANGGMQAVALDKDSEASAKLLDRTIEAFEFFGAAAGEGLLREIVPIAVQAAREIDILVERDAPDEAFEPVWARLDAYNDRYDSMFVEIYPAILADIHCHPTDWQTNDS